MRLLDKRTSADLVRLTIFMVVTAICTSFLVILIGNFTFAATKEYQAEFVDVTGVVEGDDVRVAGVKVGTVQDIEIEDRTRAILTFTVDEDVEVTDTTKVQIRYRNLVGQRYLALSEPKHQPAGEQLDEDAVIPVSRTDPALDLTVLFNGFKPLFEALSPKDINQLSYEIIQVFQGEGGTVEGLLGHTASVSQTLANRDQVIGDLIDNLNEVLVMVGDRDEELSQLIVNLRKLVHGLAQDKDPILDSLESISALSVETAGLVKDLRGPLLRDIKELRTFTGNIARNRQELDRALQVLPIKLNKIGRTATYGSWFNFFLCGFVGSVKVGPLPPVDVDYQTNTDRCSLP